MGIKRKSGFKATQKKSAIEVGGWELGEPTGQSNANDFV
jgi:hypothetical protein